MRKNQWDPIGAGSWQAPGFASYIEKPSALDHSPTTSKSGEVVEGYRQIGTSGVEKDLQQKKLVEIFPIYKVSTHPLHLVYLRNEYASRKHKMTKDLILKCLPITEITFCRMSFVFLAKL